MKNIVAIGLASFAVTACANPEFSPYGANHASADDRVIYFSPSSAYLSDSDKRQLDHVAGAYQTGLAYGRVEIFVHGMSSICHSTLKTYKKAVGGKEEARWRLSGAYQLDAAPELRDLGLFFNAKSIDAKIAQAVERDVELSLDRGRIVAEYLNETGVRADDIIISHSVVAPKSNSDCGDTEGTHNVRNTRATTISGVVTTNGRKSALNFN